MDTKKGTNPNPPVPPQKPEVVKEEKVEIPKVVKEDTVEIPKDTLKNILNRLEKVEGDNEILREVADKGRLSRIESLRNQGKLVKSARVNFIEGKAVIGWSMIKNDTYIDQEGRLHEDQVIEVTFDDHTKKSMDYRTFSRIKTQAEGEVVEESKDKDGNTNMTIQMTDGKQYKLDIRYIN